MREPILKAVSMPPRIFLAPFVIAMTNFVVQAALMFMMLAFVDLNPLVAIISIVSVHGILIICGTREPHMSKMLQAWGTSGPTSSKNIYNERGVKLAP